MNLIYYYLYLPSCRKKANFWLSLAFNVIYFIFILITSIIYFSSYEVVTAFYYLFIVILKIIILLALKDDRSNQKIPKSYIFSGIIILLMNIILSIMMSYIVNNQTIGSCPEIIIYPYALYSFINLGFAIKNLINIKYETSNGIKLITYIKFISTLMTLYNLENVMIYAFSDTYEDRLALIKILFGAFIVLINSLIAVYLLIKGVKWIKKSYKNN